ncbi:MAG: anti-sigma factor [Cellvibrionaceae bacterium]|nr:anti-sigma factor [Cellvibrionaceae bacterium]
MKYNDPELIERLSAEFVLGTLRGKARDRFEHLMGNSHRIRVTVWKWERRLTPIARMEPLSEPPPNLWAGIESKIAGVVGVAANDPLQESELHFDNTPVALPVKSNAVPALRWWGISATAASIVLAAMLVTKPAIQPEAPGGVDSVALFSDEQAQPQWLVSFDSSSGQLKAKALNEIAIQAGKAFELWVLPESGNPKSLGLLPVSENYQSQTALPLALIELLSTANGLAVSIEPTGGSPTGLPTGPIAYQSTIIDL